MELLRRLPHGATQWIPSWSSRVGSLMAVPNRFPHGVAQWAPSWSHPVGSLTELLSGSPYGATYGYESHIQKPQPPVSQHHAPFNPMVM